MDRRKFLRNTTVGGLALPTISLNACNTNPENKEGPEKSTDEFELNELTIDELQQGMESGRYTSRSITEMYLGRIEVIDKKGPAVNAVIEINPDALTIADKMDSERTEGKIRGLLRVV